MRLPSTDRGAVDTLRNHILSKFLPGIGAWGELALLRAWKDDFLGCALHEQYTTGSAGGGINPALVNGKHGGWVRTNAGILNAGSSMVILGVGGAPFYYTLDADNGWSMIWRMELGQVANIDAGALAFEWTNQYTIFCGLRTDIHAANWIIRCVNAAGNSFTNTGVAADTNPHEHALEVSPTPTGHQVKYSLDGTLIGTHATNIYNGLLHPVLWCVNRGGSGTDRTADFDFWAVVPV